MRAIMIVAALGMLLSLFGCFDDFLEPETRCICTTEFAQICVVAIDPEGRPVTDLQLEITMTRTGEVLDASMLYHDRVSGTYGIFNDAFIELVSPALRNTGELIRVAGVGGNAEIDETFGVGVPGKCPCHVRKLWGPDTVIAGQ